MVLTIRELRNFNCLSRTRQWGRLTGCIIYSPLWLRTYLCSLVGRVNYILTSAWGFRHCSFRQTGQCEGLRIVERAEDWLHVFYFVYPTNIILTANQGVVGLFDIQTMKAVGILCALLLTMYASPSFAQISKEQAKERKEIMKSSKSELTQKATKVARKEAKKLSKEGWTTTPGALPIEKQLDKAYMMSYEYDDNMFPKYIMGEAMSIGENYDAAKMQALELAKQNLAGQIQTEVTALVENTVANKQLSQEQAASVTQSIMASKNLISQSIGRTIPVMEVYRTLSNKNKEVLVRIAYNSNMAKEAAKKIVREDLEKKGEKLHKDLDKLLGW